MKKVGDIMKELGFRPEATEGTKRAFIKNLINSQNTNARASHGASATTKDEETKSPTEQLSFKFEYESENFADKNKKAG